MERSQVVCSMLALCGVAFAFAACFKMDAPTSPGAPAKPISLTVRLEMEGQFGARWPWILDVDNAGNAKLRILYIDKVREFAIPPAELERFANELEREEYFELGETYGEMNIDGNMKKITVSVGHKQHTVRLYSVRLDRKGEETGTGRALRVWMLARAWFSDPDAAL